MVGASGFEPGGCGFESHLPSQTTASNLGEHHLHAMDQVGSIPTPWTNGMWRNGRRPRLRIWCPLRTWGFKSPHADWCRRVHG